jgi:predicted RNA binding protein YcfA (HicA-like mRNA interferase family)
MPRGYSVRKVIKVLESKSFFFISQTGSHAKYRKHGKPSLTIIIPIHDKDIPYGTFRSILRQAELKENHFKKK